MPLRDGFAYPPVGATDIERGLYVTGVGRLVYAPGQGYPCIGHPHDYDFSWDNGRVLADFAIVLIEMGQGEFEDRGMGRVTWNAREVLLLPSGVWHRYRPLRTTGWTETWLTVNGEFMHQLRAKNLFPRVAVLRELEQPRAFLRAFHRFRATRPHNSLLLASRALEVVAFALETAEVRHRGGDQTVTGDPVVDAAIECVRLHSHRPLDVSAVAAQIGVTRRTLERRFRAVHPRSVAAEIVWSRLQRARLMLAENRMSVKEVGYAAGFSGAQPLIRAFRREFGQTPSEFRARAGVRS